MTRERLCRKTELSSNVLHKFWVKDFSVLATLDADGKVYVFQSSCPHAQKTLQQATWDPVAKELTCRFHWIQFELHNCGKAKNDPNCANLQIFESETQLENGVEVVYVHNAPRGL